MENVLGMSGGSKIEGKSYEKIEEKPSGFPGGSEGRESTYNAGGQRLIPGLGRSPGEGNGNPLQDSCLDNPMEREAWQAAIHGVAKSRARLISLQFLSCSYLNKKPHSNPWKVILVYILISLNPSFPM